LGGGKVGPICCGKQEGTRGVVKNKLSPKMGRTGEAQRGNVKKKEGGHTPKEGKGMWQTQDGRIRSCGSYEPQPYGLTETKERGMGREALTDPTTKYKDRGKIIWQVQTKNN